MAQRSVTATGRSPGDHVCWPFHGQEDLARATHEYVEDGLARGERVAVVDVGGAGALSALLARVGDAERLAAGGQLVVIELPSMPGSGPTDDRSTAVAALEQMTRDALADGWSGLRVIADVTQQVRHDDDRVRFARYEQLVDRFCLGRPLTAMCGYDLSRLDGDAVAEVACLHRLTRGTPSPFLLRAIDAWGTLALSGEVDSLSADVLERAIRAVGPREGEDVLIDASALDFVDHAAILALDRAARSSDGLVTLRGASTMASWLVDALGVEHVRTVFDR